MYNRRVREAGITPEVGLNCGYLVEAAWIARKDTEMQNYYRNIKVKNVKVSL
jgi:hypothetical protein